MTALYFIFDLGFYFWDVVKDYYGDTEIKIQAYVLGFIFGFVAMIWEACF